MISERVEQSSEVWFEMGPSVVDRSIEQAEEAESAEVPRELEGRLRRSRR